MTCTSDRLHQTALCRYYLQNILKCDKFILNNTTDETHTAAEENKDICHTLHSVNFIRLIT